MKEIIVLSTADTLELAKKIASTLVEEGEAACVNIIPGVLSIYRWEGKINEDQEFLLVIKSAEEKFEAIRTKIRQLHTYQTPEVIEIPIADGDAVYIDWLRASLFP
jgi:periplasmic divalent cation tolerance protein